MSASMLPKIVTEDCALAAVAMQSLAWFTQQTTALRPVWTLAHVLVLAHANSTDGASTSRAGSVVGNSMW